MNRGALKGVRVVEVAEMVAGPYCAKLLADLGAEVIKVERPQGDPARRRGPFPGDIPHPEKSGLFFYLNTSKKGVTLDLDDPLGRELFLRLLEGTHLLVYDLAPAVKEKLSLGYDQLQKAFPGLVVLSITPFGDSGPYRDYRAYPLNVFHASGEGYMTPGATPFPERPPVKVGRWVGEYSTGIVAVGAAMAALFWQRRTGQGQHIDFSRQEALLFQNFWELMRYLWFGELVSRATAGFTYAGPMKCRDGYVEFAPVVRRFWDSFFDLLGSVDGRFRDRDFLEAEDRRPLAAQVVAGLTREQLYALARKGRVPLAPYYRLDEVAASPQLEARGFFMPTELCRLPSVPYQFSGTPARPGLAPFLGEHNEEVFCSRLGLSRRELLALREAGIV